MDEVDVVGVGLDFFGDVWGEFGFGVGVEYVVVEVWIVCVWEKYEGCVGELVEFECVFFCEWMIGWEEDVVVFLE